MHALISFFFFCVCVCVLFFFLQAEDGIRDLVRSRGLGDVYKRQISASGWAAPAITRSERWHFPRDGAGAGFVRPLAAGAGRM